jgi:hypothetical protein
MAKTFESTPSEEPDKGQRGKEADMYIGGGVLALIVIILLLMLLF